MSVIPSTRLGQIEFFEAHLPVWAASPASIGLNAAQVTSLNSLTAAARTAFNSAEASRQASKASTENFYNKTGSMLALGTDLVKIIKAFAAAQNDPNVYVLAQIPAPKSPSPMPPPGMCTDFQFDLMPGGLVTFGWKCENPSGAHGTVYEVARRIGSAPESGSGFVVIGVTGSKSFSDSSLPPGDCGGTAGVTYQVTAIRSTSRGPANQFTVNFGAGMSNESESQGGEENQMKMAA